MFGGLAMDNNNMSLQDILVMVAKYNVDLKKQITEQQQMLLDTFYAMIISNIFKILKDEQFNLKSLDSFLSNEQVEEISQQTIEYLELLKMPPVQQIEILLKTAIIITFEHPAIQRLAVNIRETLENSNLYT